MTRGSASVVVASGCVSAATVGAHAGLLSPQDVAATPASVGDGRVWLLLTSALLADHPALASIGGLLLVGLAAVRLCGPRTAWTAAVAGHVGSAGLVYAALAAVHVVDPSAFASVSGFADYGTSAIIAAWVGAIAYRLWVRGSPRSAVALVAVSSTIALLIGIFLRTLTVLDAEHVVALAVGAAAMRWVTRVSRGARRPARTPPAAVLRARAAAGRAGSPAPR